MCLQRIIYGFVALLLITLLACLIVGCSQERVDLITNSQDPDFAALEQSMQTRVPHSHKPMEEKIEVPAAPIGISGTRIIIEASSWIGVSYVWGGESKNGIDCSGLVRQVYMTVSGGTAYYKDRTANSIMRSSCPVWPPKPGDVMIFVNKNTRNCSHVGIYVKPGPYGYGDCYFIHAGQKPGKVVEDRLYYSPYYGAGWWFDNFDIYVARYNPDYWES